MLKFLKPYTKQLVAGPVFKLTEAVLELLLPLMMAALLDSVSSGADTADITRQALRMLGVSVVGLCSALVCQYYASVASQGYGTSLRRALIEKLTALDASAVGRLGSSSLLGRVTGDTQKLQYAVAMLIRLVVRAPFLCIGASIMAITINPRLSIIVIALVLLLSFVLWLVMSRTVPLSLKLREKLDKLIRLLRETLSGVRVVRAFTREREQDAAFASAADEHREQSERLGVISAVLAPATQLLMNLAIALLVWLGAGEAAKGDMTKGDIVAFVSYITQIMLQMVIIARLVVQYANAYASAKRVSELLLAEPDVRECEQPKALPEQTDAPAISFEGVFFRYPSSEEDALTDISFTVAQGETVGIIGATGSGKSTLLRLLTRDYDPQRGTVRVLGEDLRGLSLASLRGCLGIVRQRAALFSGTVADNLRGSRRDLPESELIRAAQAAQAYPFIEKLEGGINARVERGGANFSGGQRQRLSIARALAKKPRLLLLDDATSALDAVTDAALRTAVAEFSRGMTVLIISQRVSAVRSCDRIVVTDDGELIACGTHSELLESCELYREIYDSQCS